MQNTNINNITKTNMQDINNMTGIQSEIEFLKSLHTLQMQLSGIGKNLIGYGYKYQNFNEILREIKQVIKSNNLDIGFIQCPTIKNFDGKIVDVMQTTFYSTKTGYKHSFDTPMCIDKLQAVEGRSKMTFPQQVGTNITYFKRYALVSYLAIESEVDNDASDLDFPIQDNIKDQNNIVDTNSSKIMQEDVIPNNDMMINNNAIHHNKISNNVINDMKNNIIKNNMDNHNEINNNMINNNDMMINNNAIHHNIKKNDQSTSTLNKEKANSIKFNGYKNMLIAARNMHNYVKSKPFDSIDQINSYLSDIEIGNDDKLLNHFSKRKELKSIKYWIKLIRNYISSNNSLKSKLDQFNAFIAFKGHLYQNSTIKLFSFLSDEIELKCLF